jgi:Diacylglycerol acyltransferase
MPSNKKQQQQQSDKIDSSSSSCYYYKFEIGQLSDQLYHPHVPVQQWLATTTTAGKDGFTSNSLNTLHDITWDVHMERLLGIALYMAWNVIPFALPLLTILTFALLPSYYFLRNIFYFVVSYVIILDVIMRFFFSPYFIKKYNVGGRDNKNTSFFSLLGKDVYANQFLYTERNIAKYLSIKLVWPSTLQRPNMQHTPLIFCVVPHGVAPIGITTYPLWSRLWNDRLCHWTAAPSVLNIPLVGYFMKKLGYIAASQTPILETLMKKEENVGIILDGIDGMFSCCPEQEIAAILQRKGIVKIALKAGVPLVPVYGFGHTLLWTIVVDPFGLLQYLSKVLGISLVPFFGRFGWFLGPPRRLPVAVCLGEPVKCPRIDNPTQDEIDKYHQELLDAYHELFEKHKVAYGWQHKTLKFV